MKTRRFEKPDWRMLAVVVGGAALMSVFAPPPIGPGPAYADECSELRSAIQQLDQQIANMGSGGSSGGGSGGQVGALQDARNNYANAYNSMNCANGGLSSGGGGYSGGGSSDLDRALSAIQLGAAVVDLFSSNNANADRARIWKEAQAHIEKTRRETYEYQQQVQGRINEQFGQMIRGVDSYVDPRSNDRVELSAGYQNAWSNGKGEDILSDSVNFDPRVALQEDWTMMKKEHGR